MNTEDDMNVILVGKNHGKSRVIPLHAPVLAVAALLVLALVSVAAWSGYRVALIAAEPQEPVRNQLVSEWQQKLNKQREQLEQVRENARHQMDALTLRIGELQGRLLRLDALGQRFVESGMVASGEFNFDQPPAMGGPEESAGPAEAFSVPELSRMIDELAARIDDRERQLRLLDEVSSQSRLEEERYVEGRPITWGWLSSRYGYRSDPFTGKRAWHAGVDLAGKDGSDIIATAGGVVTYAGERHGYGNLVEVDHGDGLVTRYAHCKTLKVEVGDLVQKGQVLALMGSTGRSTGPHVHFEVLRNGKTENPQTYISRGSR
jgi:murein DD-endopeptidase MepM/ murein hydrolase activator NlpD